MCHLIGKKWLDKPNGWNRETPIFRQIFRNGDSGDVHGHGEDVADSSDGDVVGNADLRPNWNVRRASDVSDDQHVNLGFFKRDDQRRKLGMSMNGSDNHVASPLNSGTKDPDVLFKRLTIMTPVVKLFSMFLLVMFIKPIGMVKRNGV